MSGTNLNRMPQPYRKPSRKANCHPEGRAFCGPKDLCNLLAVRRCRQLHRSFVAKNAPQDDKWLGFAQRLRLFITDAARAAVKVCELRETHAFREMLLRLYHDEPVQDALHRNHEQSDPAST